VKRLFLLLLIPALFGCATTSKNSGETVREFDLTTTPKDYDRPPYRVCPPVFPGFGTYCIP
jgi:hypothetical protein